jgi:hypothetical protein
LQRKPGVYLPHEQSPDLAGGHTGGRLFFPVHQVRISRSFSPPSGGGGHRLQSSLLKPGPALALTTKVILGKCGRRAARLIVSKQPPRLDVQPFSDPRNVVDRNVSLRTLDSAQIGPIDSAVISQSFLAQSAASTKPAHILRQYVPQRSFVRPLHGRA